MDIDIGNIFWESFWQGVMMVLKQPMMWVILVLIIAGGILSFYAKKLGARYWTKVRTRARLEEQDKYRKEKKSTNERPKR